MSLKSELLKELEANRETYLSGQYLGEKFGVSRNSVWKAIRQLEKEGHTILSGPNKGYCLASDLLSAEGIRACLPAVHSDLDIFCYREIDSTNNEAKRLASAGLLRPALVVAEAQTAGRGRNGRAFYSPQNTGLYMTLALRPPLELFDAVLITTAAAVAVARAIEALTPKKPQIKWVNDIYLDGKKLCGILTEAVTDVESRTVQNVIIGIGVNIRTADFPEGVAAVSLNAEGITRNRLAAEIAGRVLDVCERPGDKTVLDEYRAHSLVLGRAITYTKNGVLYHAKATGIDDSGGLIICGENGETDVLRSGEISVRLSE